MLLPQARTYIVHYVIESIIEHGDKLTVKKCEDLAEQITSLFPTECRDTYFSQTNKKLAPKGKLWDRYQGRKRYVAKLNQNSKRLKLHNRNPDHTSNMMTTTGNEEYDQICADLKHIRDWDTVLTKWKQTISYRKNRLFNLDLTLHQILDEWPLYKYSKAPELVDIDYNDSFPGNGLNFSNWNHLCAIASDLFEQRIKDPQTKQLRSRVFGKKDVLNIDNFNIYIMMLLHAVLLPTAKNLHGRHKMPSQSQ
ncbi:uncharacterized protein LOC118732628 [Rhagoletis pomonella]|uniref:uncharacterized protein LOC118732628 n=1 Tax=Rhagoletis pomonella TaxID=28610 RepID=UPI00177FE2AB|nr:uncharacterized protein LOC118732628 [Rhagoletis pomonella]